MFVLKLSGIKRVCFHLPGIFYDYDWSIGKITEKYYRENFENYLAL